MESRFRSIFLIRVALATWLSFAAIAPVWAQDALNEAPQVIEPQVQRRDIDVKAIDTEDWEVSAFVGYMSIEDFESDVVYGARLAYHVNESIFTEATIGTTDAGLSSTERQDGAPILSDSEREFTYYDLSVGYNLFPGEVFFRSNRAFNSVIYLIAGVGSTDFAGEDQFTANFGFGAKVLPTDYMAIRLDVRDYIVDVDVLGTDKTTHNMQATLNFSYFF